MEFTVGVEFEDFLVFADDLDFEILVLLLEAATGLTALGMVEDDPGRLDPDASMGFRGFSEVLTFGITLDVKSHERLVKSLSVSSSMMISCSIKTFALEKKISHYLLKKKEEPS